MNPPLITADEVWRTLGQILDPEFGIPITDLGLIYSVVVEDGHVQVDMTLTTPTCPAGGMMLNGVQRALETLPGVRSARANLVWDPVWTPAMLTENARRQLDAMQGQTPA